MIKENQRIKFVTPRETIEIQLDDGRVLSGPRGLSVEEFLTVLNDPKALPIVGAVVNGELRELTYPIERDSLVRPIDMGEADGMRFYRRSLTFLLEAAFYVIFPGAKLTIDHSVFAGGYYCRVLDHHPISLNELKLIEAHMRQLVLADLPFERRKVPIEEAIRVFQTKGYDDKVRLLTHRKKEYLMLYSLDTHLDYHHGYMVPSTRYLKWFSLVPTDGGFTLRFPRRHKPTEIVPLPANPTLLATFRRYGDWLERLGIGSVGALNDSIKEDRIQEVILVSEALHEQHINEIASQIVKKLDKLRVIIIAGPSSSGKTTFSKRLSIQLLARGISPFPLGMDNYFVDREKTPVDENGELDFESIEALNRNRLCEDLNRLILGEQVQIPRFNFAAGKSETGDVIHLHADQIIILEGIHGMNPKLIPDIPTRNIFRVYASTLTQLNLDRHNRVSTTDTRLLRRIVRDAHERGYTAQDTINRWESVRRGEKRNIFPYQEIADSMFNSALVYELAALKPLVEPLLRQVPFATREHVEAKRLLAILEWFLPLKSDYIPDNSLLREFVGGSILREFKLWQQ